jgi:hypothetical protein
MSLDVQDNALQTPGPAIWLLDGDAHRLSNFQEAVEKEPPATHHAHVRHDALADQQRASHGLIFHHIRKLGHFNPQIQ